MNKIIILIPAYKPDHRLINFIKELNVQHLPILVVDDGSGKNYQDIFDAVKKIGIQFVNHQINKGKGAALKTGLAQIIQSYPETSGIITADCDGRHKVTDIMKIIDLMHNNPHVLILGSHSFINNSSFSQKITKTAFKFFTGLNISDIQTGLRGLPSCMFKDLLQLEGKRFDYEINMLLRLKTWGITYIEIPVETIYPQNNTSTYHHSIIDFILIFKQFLTMLATSILSFGIDYLLFILFHIFSGFSVAICYILARIISSLLNYTLNSKAVFKAGNLNCFIRYYILAAFIMLIGSLGTQFLANITNMHVIFCKLIIDLFLFLVNYYIQKNYVFVKKIR